MKTKQVVLATGLALLALVGIGLWMADRALEDLCQNTLLEEVPAPGGARKAVVFHRSCGATTGDSTQISLLSADAPLPDGVGNLVAADTDHGRAPAGPGGGPRLRAVWRGDEELLVYHHGAARLFHEQSSLEGVSVRYLDEPEGAAEPPAALD